jgi:hypothetical protein
LARVPAASARAVPLRGAPRSWLLAGANDLCLLRSEPSRSSRRAYSLNCVTVAAARAGYLMSTFSAVPGAPGETLLEGLLPDGAHAAELTSMSGSSTRLALSGGAYYAIVPNPRSVGFELDGRQLAVAVPTHGPATGAAAPGTE